jgi:hypothetical protein
VGLRVQDRRRHGQRVGSKGGWRKKARPEAAGRAKLEAARWAEAGGGATRMR